MQDNKSSEKSKKGRKSRASGARFETKVRQNLEELGWNVTKWTNTVDYEKNKIVPAKRKYNPYLKALSIGTGFPDFVCFRHNSDGSYEIVGIEVKSNGYLDKVERGMCVWMLENKIFPRILIAKKAREGRNGTIEYVDFNKRYNKSHL
ncbi:MAG: hypothetical protein KGH55_02770 [Nanoarchaeota archaeon]|nr:hypothetical protein [Nanoarchaeota archaeon]